MTYTYVTLGISRAAYDEIAGKLKAAKYNHLFKGETIDMHGIALEPQGSRLRDFSLDAGRYQALRWFMPRSLLRMLGDDRAANMKMRLQACREALDEAADKLNEELTSGRGVSES